MATYNTNNTLGSADPRDLFDNSQIADHFVSDTENESWPDRFGNSRKTWKGIENEAESQLTDQENSFQQFLLNSGYEPLADYVDGPITFTRRNQITAYDGEFYRPKASVTLPYTTTGNTATTWATDEANFVAVGDAALRQELASSDGQKYIGTCPDLTTLRSIEPSQDYQFITLKRSVTNGAIINQSFIYDSSDTSSADDGYRIIVTPGGARWKADVSRGIDVRLAGLLADGSNIGSCLNKIAQGEVAKIVAASSLDAAVCVVNIPIPGFPCFFVEQYINDETIYWPSYLHLNPDGPVIISVPDNIGGISFDNNQFSVTSDMIETEAKWRNGGIMAGSDNGLINFIGSNKTVRDNQLHFGIALGNTAAGSTIPDMANVVLKNIKCTQFSIGQMFRGYDTYTITHDNVSLQFNADNLYTPSGAITNSGENIVYKRGVISNAVYDNVLWKIPQFTITFDGTSIDYAGVNAIHLVSAYGCTFRFINGAHIEGFGNMMILAEGWPTWAPSATAKNVIYLDKGQVVAAGKSQSAYAPRRAVIDTKTNYTDIVIRDTPINWVSSPNQPMVQLQAARSLGNIYYESPLSQAWAFNDKSSNDAILPKLEHTINYNKSTWSGAAGDAKTNTTDSGTGFSIVSSDSTKITATLSASESFMYGGVTHTFLGLEITSTDASATIEIQANNLIVPFMYGSRLNAAVSLCRKSVTSGSPTITCGGTLKYSPKYTTTASTVGGVTTYSTGKTYSTTPVAGNAVDVGAYFDVTAAGLDSTDYVGAQCHYIDGVSAISPTMVSPKLIISGFVGTIRIAYPLFWVTRGTTLEGASEI